VYEDKDCNPDKLDHAVLLVGYGTENGKDYWLVCGHGAILLDFGVFRRIVLVGP
jgi:hypothetical protein